MNASSARRSCWTVSNGSPNIRWEITVSPDSGGDVTITLPVTEDCDADGAICANGANGANGDKKLSNRLERTVSGPGG